jgi:hypothetical protein
LSYLYVNLAGDTILVGVRSKSNGPLAYNREKWLRSEWLRAIMRRVKRLERVHGY